MKIQGFVEIKPLVGRVIRWADEVEKVEAAEKRPLRERIIEWSREVLQDMWMVLSNPKQVLKAIWESLTSFQVVHYCSIPARELLLQDLNDLSRAEIEALCAVLWVGTGNYVTYTEALLHAGHQSKEANLFTLAENRHLSTQLRAGLDKMSDTGELT